MIRAGDVGGVHVKYLYHCPRQLWLYARGLRPERLNEAVAAGEAVHEVRYARHQAIDLGAARLDHLDGDRWVHEVKSSRRPTDADQAQARHYCLRLAEIGVEARGAVLHYPATRRTVRIPYDRPASDAALADIAAVLSIVACAEPPDRLPRNRCRGCSFLDYCWTE